PLYDQKGERHRLRWISSLLYTPEGEVEGIVILGEDVTEREKTAQALTESEAILRQITDNMTDLISRLDLEGKVLYASPSHYTVLGYQVEEMKHLTLADLVHPEDVAASINKLKVALQQGETSRNQQRSRHANGTYIWTETVVNPVREDGKITGVILSSRDITERKKLEDDLRFLSVHDQLTGLYNRTYFEAEMERLNSGRYDPVGIVVCDLDGLKLVNDTLGHEAGDRLLISTAAVLKQCFRQSDVVSRVGGDEFAILLPGSNHDQLEMLVYRIYEGVGYYNEDNPDLPLSLSVGMAVRDNRVTSMRDVYKEADNEMYRLKLNRSKSARSAVVHTLMRALEARDFITEGHAERLQELAARMGKKLGLTENTISSLRLLAQFHDIGKVGVPDRILFKVGQLTTEEYNEMKRHCEIGHRIALASPELSSLAGLILKHHEWWNGKGYPEGLRGQDIPLECRILALADAYDAMTNNRPYRLGMLSRDALREIENCAGIQFDPVLADIFIDMLWDEPGQIN
ncbi:MAG: diguanylate cyclase domain-containing protein, partial [Methylocystaceae bacterium]